MKIFNRNDVYEADKFTIKEQGITGDELMERAGTRVFGWLKAQLKDSDPKINIFCGIGNNGGDGLVVARLLLEDGYDVHVYVVNYSDKRSDDFLLNLDRLKQNKHWPEFLNKNSSLPEVNEGEIVIDSIFGIGLNRPADDWVKNLIIHLNTSKAFILAIDVPSGLYIDQVPVDKKGIINANVTLTFQIPKLVFFLPETAGYAGQLQTLDIGLNRKFIEAKSTEATLIGKEEAINLYRPRSKFSHKGTFGHCLVCGGSYGKMGSVVLASSAALKVGAGKVTAFIPKCGYQIIQTTLPEAMAITAEKEEYLVDTEIDFSPESLCFGIGAGTKPESVAVLENMMKKRKSPMVIDADGLNMLAKNKELLEFLPVKSILTPHPKELERLIGVWKDDFDKLEKAKAFADKFKIILVIKGAFSITIADKKLYVNSSGNPGMATAGTGDVLAGMIAGLLAQGYDPAIAAVFGVYLHGRAGDKAAAKMGHEAVVAGDLIQYLGEAFLDLFDQKEK